MAQSHSTTEAILVSDENRRDALADTSIFFRLICRLMSLIERGVFIFQLPDGRRLKFAGDLDRDIEAVLVVRDFAFARRVVLGGDIGFYESFADGQWDSPNISACLTVLAMNVDQIKSAFTAFPVIAWIDNLRHALNKNTKEGSRRNIAAHYDLGNAFYEKWLDRTMTYSSARYPSPGADLSAAQTNKYRTLAQSIDLRPGETVLEIGSGWGGFAEFAAKEVGANVTGLTISKEQISYAQERIFREGLAEKVTFKLQDYRDQTQTFDKIASIEMFEAVGREYWPAYFSKVRDSLKPGGVAGLQIITIADRLFDHYKNSTDFIQRYVFPGGMLPSPSILKDQIDRAGLVWRDAVSFGQDYAKTLNAWQKRFLAAWDEITPLGFDDRFQRLWRFYLAYCEAGFRAGTTDVHQLSISRL